MMRNRIFIYEFISGGGFNKVDIPASLFCEGFGMLKSIIEDFKSIGFEITTLLDYRIYQLSGLLLIDNFRVIQREDNYLKQFKILVKNCEYVFVIAPESTNILYQLTNIVTKYNKILLSTSLEGIKIGTSKIQTYEFFQKNKVKTPKTYLIPLKRNKLDSEFIIRKFHELSKPIVIKPEDGVGAESIYFFETENEIKKFFQDYQYKIEIGRYYILQEYIRGKDLSLSLINIPRFLNPTAKGPYLLSVNSQNVNIKDHKYDSEYFGGYTPIKNYNEISNSLTKVLHKIEFSQFFGYFGIDLIRTTDMQYYFIEINPRLTTSYIGLRNSINKNPAQLILNSKLNGLMPKNVKVRNFSLFRRIQMEYYKPLPSSDLKEQLTHNLIELIPELVTPPISLNESNQFTCLIATKTNDLNSSKKRFQEIKQLLEEFDFTILK
ncbi:MAG: ATP-grasp domain-containing protein [Promethearchaeota archaeon]